LGTVEIEACGSCFYHSNLVHWIKCGGESPWVGASKFAASEVDARCSSEAHFTSALGIFNLNITNA
jgi:hypothetical protein